MRFKDAQHQQRTEAKLCSSFNPSSVTRQKYVACVQEFARGVCGVYVFGRGT